jgi:hypothetical protein
MIIIIFNYFFDDYSGTFQIYHDSYCYEDARFKIDVGYKMIRTSDHGSESN